MKIARDLDFVEVKAFAIRGLQGCTIDLAERVGIYQKYTADITYLIPLFAELCVRDEGPTDEESEKMGAKTSLMIFRVRERLRCGSTGSVDLAAAIEAISAAVGYNTNASATTSSGGSNPGSLVLFLIYGRLVDANITSIFFRHYDFDRVWRRS